jgi:hypothetical protein
VPLAAVVAGQTSAAAQLDQLIDLLTGVMHDQPVTLKGDYSAVSPNLRLSSLTALTKGGWIAFQDAGTNKWEFGKEADNSLKIWDSARGGFVLQFASNGDITLPSAAKLIGSADFRTATRLIAGADPGGGSAGDVFANRGGTSPGTGAIQFGSSAALHNLLYDGTKFNLTDPLSVVGQVDGADLAATGLTGATAGGMRFVGTTTCGPPLTGSFLVADYIYDLTTFGRWVCIVAGSPGTWVALEGAITSPPAPTVVVNTTGAVSWWYKVVTEGKNGSTFYDAIPSAAVKITNGAATPNNTINWTAPIGVDAARVAYVVLRSSDGVTYSRIAFPGVGVLTFTDNNATAFAYTAATANPGGGRVIGDHIYRARVRLTTNQAIAFNPGYVKILYQTVDYDPNSDWDATNHVYVVPVSGFYQVAHEQSYNFGSQTGFFESGIILNGAAAPMANSGSSAQIDNSNSWMQGCAAAPTIYFNAGDTLAIVTAPQMTVGAATLVGDGSARSTHATFEYRGS